MTEEKPITPEEQVKALEEVLASYQFFSNQVQGNISLFKGLKLVLDKVIAIEENLKAVDEKLKAVEEKLQTKEY